MSRVCLMLKATVSDKMKVVRTRTYMIYSENGVAEIIVREIPVDYGKYLPMEPLVDYKNRIKDRKFVNRTSFLVWLQTQLAMWLRTSKKSSKTKEDIEVKLVDSPKRICRLIDKSHKIFSSVAEVIESVSYFFDEGTLKSLKATIDNTKKNSGCFNK